MNERSIVENRTALATSADLGTEVFSEQAALSRRNDRGFTIVELLTVIAIIAILASMLFSALSGAKTRGLTARCTSNLKQFALAFQLYAGDHEERVLPNLDGESVPLGKTWVEGWLGVPGPDCTNVLYLKRSLIAGYVGEPKIWRCPSSKDPLVDGRRMPRVRTLSLNGFIGYPRAIPGAAVYRRTGDMLLPSPSELMVFVEERIDTINDGSFAQQFVFASDYPESWVLRDKPATVHNRGLNVSFADGHVRTHRWQDSRTLYAPRDDSLMPNNIDVAWLQKHGTWRER